MNHAHVNWCWREPNEHAFKSCSNLIQFCDCTAGVLTGTMIRIVGKIRERGGEVVFEGFGKFTLAEDLADIEDRTDIDLSSFPFLEGE